MGRNCPLTERQVRRELREYVAAAAGSKQVFFAFANNATFSSCRHVLVRRQSATAFTQLSYNFGV